MQPTVGTHRMAVAEVVARLLSIGDPAVNVAVSEQQLVTALMRLCLDRPHCSPLQTMCLRMLRWGAAIVVLQGGRAISEGV